MAKAYHVIKTMEAEESFAEICETRIGVSKSTGYNWAKVGEAFGGYTVRQMKDLGTAEISKLQILAQAPGEEIHHLLTDGTFYGEDKDEILSMSRRELSEFMAKQRYQENLIATLKKEVHDKNIKLRESEIGLRDKSAQIAALKGDDPRLQVPPGILPIMEMVDAAEYALDKLYNYFNDNIHDLPQEKEFESLINSRYSRFVARTDLIIEVMKKIAFRRGFPVYRVPGLEPEMESIPEIEDKDLN